MTELRWGDQVPAGVEAARQRLLDAAEACIDRYGLAKTTVEDIATEAKVSRATIYRYFDNRDELVLAVVLRSLDRWPPCLFGKVAFLVSTVWAYEQPRSLELPFRLCTDHAHSLGRRHITVLRRRVTVIYVTSRKGHELATARLSMRKRSDFLRI